MKKPKIVIELLPSTTNITEQEQDALVSDILSIIFKPQHEKKKEKSTLHESF